MPKAPEPQPKRLPAACREVIGICPRPVGTPDGPIRTDDAKFGVQQDANRRE